MASSPSCSSSTSPTDVQEADVFSDDSGVDVKPQGGLRVSEPGGRRNKRKSSEPKKRKDVVLMKRFRWDTDDEDEDNDDVFDERPGSGDSGYCCRDATEKTQPPAERFRNSTTCVAAETQAKKRPKQWRKPKEAIKEEREDLEEDEGNPPAFRQSVIRKNETTTTCCGTPEQTGGVQLSDPSFGECRGPPLERRPRNYKSMSRQRRIEANARERTRVHTISAAFESLRRAVPAYAHNQKLSKLAILRIASAYIVALACLNGGSQTPPADEECPMSECVERCTRTIQAEGRSRRRTTSSNKE